MVCLMGMGCRAQRKRVGAVEAVKAVKAVKAVRKVKAIKKNGLNQNMFE
jgi:hypothetical protein